MWTLLEVAYLDIDTWAFWETDAKLNHEGIHSSVVIVTSSWPCIKCSVVHFFLFQISTEFLIQYEDLLHRRGHWHNLTEVPGNRTTAHLKLSPHVHYTFRVVAYNGVGFSRPSLPSRIYKTEPAGRDSAVVNPPWQLKHILWVNTLIEDDDASFQKQMNDAEVSRGEGLRDSCWIMFHFVCINNLFSSRREPSRCAGIWNRTWQSCNLMEGNKVVQGYPF